MTPTEANRITEGPEPIPQQKEKRKYQEQSDPFQDAVVVNDEKSAPHEIVKEFISFEGIEGKTNLTPKQIKAFMALKAFDQDFPEYNVGRLRHFLLLKISEQGQSRKGLLDMLRGNIDMQNHNDTPPFRRSNY